MLVLQVEKFAAINVHLPDGRIIAVKLLKAACGKARLAFDAPDDIEIWRDEIDPLNESAVKTDEV